MIKFWYWLYRAFDVPANWARTRWIKIHRSVTARPGDARIKPVEAPTIGDSANGYHLIVNSPTSQLIPLDLFFGNALA